MTAITQAVLVHADIAVRAMGVDERLQLADEIFQQQPNLLASVLVLPSLGVTMAQLESVITILFVAWQAMKTSPHQWPLISEDVQQRCLDRLTGRIGFLEGLSGDMLAKATQQQIDEHPEPYLLAFVFGHLGEHDLVSVRTEAEKYLLLAALNLVDCIAAGAPSQPQPRTTPKRRR
ncbi:MAG: hypothetical protein RLZZ618_3570 [Pseudomonadota bacterium]|jgi:hypothetical protein